MLMVVIALLVVVVDDDMTEEFMFLRSREASKQQPKRVCSPMLFLCDGSFALM